jgi:predicted RNase H-like nuclease (RuvC/YqgF family)
MEIDNDSLENNFDLNEQCISLSKQIQKYIKIIEKKNCEINRLKSNLSKKNLIGQNLYYLRRRNNYLKKNLQHKRKTNTRQIIRNDPAIPNQTKILIGLLLHEK